VIREPFTYAPHLALALGALAGIGILRSAKLAGVLTLGLMLVQLLAWTCFLTATGTEGADWNTAFVVGFLLSLAAVVPYTVIGAVLGAGAVLLLRYPPRRRG